MSSPRTLLLMAAAVVVAVLVGWALTTGGSRSEPVGTEGVGPGAALSGAERAELAGPPVQAGPPATAVPTVSFADPEAVARAYLVAAHSQPATGDPASSDRTNRSGSPYAVPTGPGGTVGVLVLDPPPPGQAAVVTVIGLALFGASPAGDRRGYRVDYRTATGPPGALGPPGPVRTRHLVLVRQSDNRWLVAVDTTDMPSGEN